ncbi:MAG: hypothetical protein ABI775_00305 [Pseudonocardiales bacterium]
MTGAVGGAIASLVMAMYAMVASATYQHHGFFTPLYHIASTLIAPTQLMVSMQHAMMGSTFYFAVGPAVLGAAIHMMTGAIYGVVFVVAVHKLRLHGAIVLGAAAVWGAIVFAVSSWIALPMAAKVFNSGDQITHMAKMVGYPTFLVEHLIFGLALGALLLARTARRADR